MNALTLGETAIRQLDGLYSLNDLHAASGGDKKHEPHQFMRNDQTQALIAELNSANSRSFQTTPGRKGGTYVCRELVIAYAAWISAAFHLKVIRCFLDVNAPPPMPPAPPAPKDKLSKELRAHINRTAHQLALKQYDSIHSMLMDCALDNLACGAKQEDCFGYVDAYGGGKNGMVLISVRDLYEIVWNAQQVINTAGSAIAAIKRVEDRTGIELALRIPRSKHVDKDYHKHDYLVDEVIDRMAARAG